MRCCGGRGRAAPPLKSGQVASGPSFITTRRHGGACGRPLGLFGFVSHGGPQLVIVLLSLEKDEENPSHLNLLGAK